ncbi:MAG: polysaccharide export protein [Pseudomonadota bacterium]|nr:polysaccharide export protein [Pseudomonadota bacterium]MDP2351172.1 polysaccharide export protein [Pseudomonadota bacterium]
MTPRFFAQPACFSRLYVYAVLFSGLAGCAIIPGTDTYTMREQSSVKLPVKQGAEEVPANVKVKAITAELIIEQDKSLKARLAGDSAGQSNARQATEPTMADYKLGPGDILTITVWDHPELTIPAGTFRSAEQAGTLVAEDGTIFYPYVGILSVTGKTTREVRAILAQRLARVIEKVQIDVRVISYRSKRVYLVGEVNKPGQQPITDIPMTILEAVNLAAGFTKDADHSQVLLTRANTTWRVDLQSLYEDGAISQNVKLEPGDIVNVPDRSLNKVFVLGEVQKPGSYFMNKKRITLAEVLADAGYVNEMTSNPKYIFVMRGQSDSPELYHLDAKSPDALLLADRFPLRPRDIVFVDAAEVARWNRVISNVLPTATLLNTISGIDYPLFGGRQ